MLKFLNIIIYSPDEYYNYMKYILRKYLSSLNNVTYFFVVYSESLHLYDLEPNNMCIADNDTIIYYGKESFIPGCLNKTLSALTDIYNGNIKTNVHTTQKIYPFAEYDYVIRSNISTIINFKLLEIWLLKPENIGKYNYTGFRGDIINNYNHIQQYNSTIPIEKRYEKFHFISGTGIILSNLAATLLINNADQLNKNVIDDVEIGYFMTLGKFSEIIFKNVGGYKYNYNETIVKDFIQIFGDLILYSYYSDIKILSSGTVNDTLEFDINNIDINNFDITDNINNHDFGNTIYYRNRSPHRLLDVIRMFNIVKRII